MSLCNLHSLEKELFSFLNSHYCFKKPLLLGFSGGEDSTALLFALLTLKREREFPLHLAHLDHSWRKESASEAERLRRLARSFSLPFHLKKMREVGPPSELAGREARINFFRETCDLIGAEAVLTGHHASDQAETILKRLLEGGAVWSRRGMREIMSSRGLTIWRPWLSVTKKSILGYLQTRPTARPIYDYTNEDPRFLRSRLRHQMLPSLTSQFGKEIETPLCRLGGELEELHSFLKRNILDNISFIEGPLGIMCKGLEPFLNETFVLSYIASFLALKRDWILSYTERQQVASLLENRSANKQIVGKSCALRVDRGHLFLDFGDSPLPLKSCSLEDGTRFGPWKIQLEKSSRYSKSTNWSCSWNGKYSLSLPSKNYRLSSPSPTLPYQGKTRLKKWWNGKKVPAFLWNRLPVICEGEQVVGEFLTGHQKDPCEQTHDWIKIDLTYSREVPEPRIVNHLFVWEN